MLSKREGQSLAYVVLQSLFADDFKIPPYVFPMLILSKRMHSIFTLRLFNDCFAIFFFFLAIYCYQKRWWIAGSALYSIGLGVKMSLLLALPAVGIVLLQAIGAEEAIGHASVIMLIQVRLFGKNRTLQSY